jgi:hypothetical protein
MPSVPRVSNSSANSARSRARLWLMADCPIPTRAAAFVTLCSLTSASKATRRFKSIAAKLA